MFDKAHRWMARQGKLIPIVFSVLSTIVWFGAIKVLEWNISVAFFVSALTTVVYIMAPFTCANNFLVKTIKSLDNECDPYPMLLETEEQLTYKKRSDRHRLVVLMDHCVALQAVGKTKDAMDFMEQVNVEECKGLNDTIRFVYYSNLSGYCYYCDQSEKGNYYYTKAIEIRDRAKKRNFYEMYSRQINALGQLIAYKNCEYEKAIGMIEAFVAKSKREKVSTAILKAKVLFALGRIDETKKELQFVCENGNKLYAVKEAAEILAKI